MALSRNSGQGVIKRTIDDSVDRGECISQNIGFAVAVDVGTVIRGITRGLGLAFILDANKTGGYDGAGSNGAVFVVDGKFGSVARVDDGPGDFGDICTLGQCVDGLG